MLQSNTNLNWNMIVKMFDARFAPLVKAGTKKQTVRPLPKEMPQAGDAISLRMWEKSPDGMNQVILRTSTVSKVEFIDIAQTGWCWVSDLSLKYLSVADAFAQADGFTNWAEMRDWIKETYGFPFSGIVIHWD